MDNTGFPVVGIGASAGGIEAFESLFTRLPPDTGMAFVVILHLPASRKSLLVDILQRWTGMRVVEAEDGTRLEPDRIFVPPPHTLVTLQGERLSVQVPPPGEERFFRPIDSFFDSLGSVMRARAVGVVLSGTGSDGTLGLKVIKEHGGLTIAQGREGRFPQYGEMPDGAIASGSVDLVATVNEMADELMRLRESRLGPLPRPPETPEQTEAARLHLCSLLLEQVGHDFSGYRDKTFLRRVQRRMQVVGVQTLQAYIDHLGLHPAEAGALFRDLLISVTRFFRDTDTFAALKTQVIPPLFERAAQADGPVRIWVPGCATGEEAYSLAMLLREHMDNLSGAHPVQLFATDIDQAAIATARLGRYPISLLDGMAEERRQRFFKPIQGGFVVTREIRELCTFSEHNLLRDPPLSRMDLVSCRNLLIYLDNDTQASVIPLFHYSLNPGGVLLLGGAESVSRHTDLFEPLDRVARIFVRREVASAPADRAPSLLGAPVDRQLPPFTPAPPAPRPPALYALPGPAAASGSHGPLPHEPPPPAPATGWTTGWTWLAAPARTLWQWAAARTPTVRRLQLDVSRTQQAFATLEQQYQTALEDLRSANEEMHSVNEELQSANEELQTSQEELRSLNEELSTVNARLSEKVNELDATNNDLRNLFAATDIATIFLDRQLVIRSFTPAVTAFYQLIPSDQGRPLTDIAHHLAYQRLQDDVRDVLQTQRALERRVAREDQSAHYLLRILPYRAPDNSISGALITFIDVTSIVQAEASLREADVRKDAFIATLSHELRNPLAPIRTAAHLLQTPGLAPAKAEELSAVIARQVAHMSSLLDDLFDLSRISRSAFPLKKEYVAWQTVRDAAVEAVQPRLEARHHTLRIGSCETPEPLEVDPVRLTQILSNLLTNAAKFTPDEGLIELSCRLEDAWFVFSVRDNGVGIAPERLPGIFDMFSRGDADLSRTDGGLGIGLALVKGLVELHGGHIQAHSAGIGHGCEFVVSLPRRQAPTNAPHAAAAPAPSAHTAQRRVLVADDNRDGADTLATFLSLAGHQVVVAYSGEQALQMAAEHRPDVGVLDIGMPGLTGYEVAERIRREAWGRRMLLVAVTGWGQEKDRAVALSSGFDHHMTKPIDPDALEQLFDTARRPH